MGEGSGLRMNEVLKEMKKTFGGKYYDAEYSLLKIGGGYCFPAIAKQNIWPLIGKKSLND